MSSESDDELPPLPLPESSVAQPFLLCLKGGEDGREFNINTGLTRLGLPDATPSQDIVLPGKGVEEEHCLFEWSALLQEAPVKFYPIGPCRHNGQDILDAVLLADGDVIKVGSELTFRFVYPSQVSAEDLLLAELEAREEAVHKHEELLEARLKAAAQREKLAKLSFSGAATALQRAADHKRAEGELWRAEREAKAQAAAEIAEEQKQRMGDKIRAAQQEQRRQELAARLRVQAEQHLAAAKLEAEQRLEAKLEAAEHASKDEACSRYASEVEALRALKAEAERSLQSSLEEFAEEEDARQALLDHLNAQVGVNEAKQKALRKTERSERRKLAFAVRALSATSLASEAAAPSNHTGPNSLARPEPTQPNPPPQALLPKSPSYSTSLTEKPGTIPKPSPRISPKPKPPTPPPKPPPKPPPPKPKPKPVAVSGDGAARTPKPPKPTPKPQASTPALHTPLPVERETTQVVGSPSHSREGVVRQMPAASLAKLVALKATLAAMQAKLVQKEEESAAAAAAAPSPLLDKTLIKMTHHWKEMLHNENRYHQDLSLLMYFRETMSGSKDMPGCIDGYQSKTIFGPLNELEYATRFLCERINDVDETWNPASSIISGVFREALTYNGKEKELLPFVCQMYDRFITGYSEAASMLEKVSKKKNVAKQLAELQAAPECRKQKLKDLLMFPIQHMMRYTMHLNDLHKACTDTHPDKAALKIVIDAFSSEMGKVNKKKGEADAKLKEMAATAAVLEELGQFLDDIDGGGTLLKAGRSKVSSLRCKSYALDGGAKEMTLFLLTDMIVVCERSRRTSKKKMKRKSNLLNKFAKALFHGGEYPYRKEYAFPLDHVTVVRSENSTFGDFSLELTESGTTVYEMDEPPLVPVDDDSVYMNVNPTPTREELQKEVRDMVLDNHYSTLDVAELTEFCARIDQSRLALGSLLLF